MKFQVPQFIDFEDKIFGPLTLKQFIYVAGSLGIGVVLFSFLPRFLAIIFSVPVVIFGAALAFYRINNKPFIEMVEAFFRYSLNKKLYIWDKKEKQAKERKEKKTNLGLSVPKLSDSKLKDLTWSLDVKEQNNPVTK
ncbi:MAG: PrgI family protein [Candidatus Pacebacteria bacterium]|nr:PrgI family protein [Candidatus Paceibacterota bacterium]